MSSVHNSVMQAPAQGQVVIIQKGNFFSELERLKNLDNHRQKLEQIQGKDVRKSVKLNAERFDPKRTEDLKRKRMDQAQQRKFAFYPPFASLKKNDG